MRINKIKLTNFKSYYGEQEFNFSEGLNIISGKIGTGKTSLYEAFQWILLNNMSDSFSVDEDFILNKKFEFESLKSKSPEIHAKIELEVIAESESNSAITYQISKTNVYVLNEDSYMFSETNTLLSYDEPRTGNAKLIDDYREVEAKLNELFPEKLRRYLLFKGETLNQLIDFSNPVTLEQAVKQISHLPLFTRMTRIINQLINQTDRKYRNKLQANARDQKKFSKLKNDLEIKEKEKEDSKKKFNKAVEDLETLEIKETEYTEKLSFIAGFPDLKEEESRLKYERSKAFDQLEELDKIGKQKFINKWILAKGHPLLDAADVELRKFIQSRLDQIAKNKNQLELGVPGDHLINKMINEKTCLICGTKEKDKPDLVEVLKTHLDVNKEFKNVLSDEIEDLNDKVKDIVRNISFIKNTTLNIIDDLKKHIKNSRDIESEKTNCVEALKKTEEKINDLVKEKGYQILQLDPKAITNALRRLRDDKKTINNQKVFYDRKDTDLNNEIRKLKKDLEGLSGIQVESIENIPEKKALNYLEEIKNIIEEKVKQEKIDLIDKIEKEANKIQKNIIEQSIDNEIIVLYVNIDRDDYSISFIDKDGNPNPGHGAQETLAKMSLISSVLKLSNEYKQESYPFIVDAPASNFDDTITKPFIKSVSDNFSQGIVILKDIHLEIDNYKKESFTNTIYSIEKISDGKEESTITNNYSKINLIK
jgi:DNA sulfur modification protein DndD